MSALRHFLARLWPNEEGQTLTEYSLVLGLITLVAVAGLTATNGSVEALYDTMEAVGTAIQGVLSP